MQDAVIAVQAKAIDTGEFREAAGGATAGKNGHEINGLSDQRARNGDDGFLDELFHPPQRADGAAGVDGADAAGMPGASCLQEVEGFGATHLSDRDAVRAQAQG